LPESTFGTVVMSNLTGQNHLVNQGNPLYNWVLGVGSKPSNDQALFIKHRQRHRELKKKGKNC